MKLPSGVDEELELLDHISSPELDKAQQKQRDLLSNGGRRAAAATSSSAAAPGTVEAAAISIRGQQRQASQGNTGSAAAWGTALARRRDPRAAPSPSPQEAAAKPLPRAPGPQPPEKVKAKPRGRPATTMDPEDGVSLYSVEEFRRQFPNK